MCGLCKCVCVCVCVCVECVPQTLRTSRFRVFPSMACAVPIWCVLTSSRSWGYNARWLDMLPSQEGGAAAAVAA